MKKRHAGLVAMGLVTLIGCSSYIKQPTVCIDRWYGYVQEGGCPPTVKAAAVDETAARLASLERERQRLADELEAARRQNGTLSSRVGDLKRQSADRDRELAALRSGSASASGWQIISPPSKATEIG